MSNIGDLLALLNDADCLMQGFKDEYRDWSHPYPSAVLVIDPEGGTGARVRWRGGGPFPRASETRRRIWYEYPGRVRVEVVDGTELVRLGVRDGDRWWTWDRVGGDASGIVSDVDDARTTPPLLTPPLLTPARLVGYLRLHLAGTGVRLGRPVLLAHAEPKITVPDTAGLSFEFEFDSEYGTVLRRAASRNGRCVQLTEARTIRFHTLTEADRLAFVQPDLEGGRRRLESSTDAGG